MFGISVPAGKCRRAARWRLPLKKVSRLSRQLRIYLAKKVNKYHIYVVKNVVLLMKSIRTSLADFKISDKLYDIPFYLIENLNQIIDDILEVVPNKCQIFYDQSYMTFVFLTFKSSFFMLIGKMVELTVSELNNSLIKRLIGMGRKILCLPVE